MRIFKPSAPTSSSMADSSGLSFGQTPTRPTSSICSTKSSSAGSRRIRPAPIATARSRWRRYSADDDPLRKILERGGPRRREADGGDWLREGAALGRGGLFLRLERGALPGERRRQWQRGMAGADAGDAGGLAALRPQQSLNSERICFSFFARQR